MYEAKARVADPVHGCAGVINNLQKKLEEVQSQLASAQAKLYNMSAPQSNFIINLINSWDHQGNWDPNFESTLLQENQERQSINPTVLDVEVDSLPLWDY